MMEEVDEEEPGTPESKPGIPGLTLGEVENGTPALRARASLVDIRAASSPSHNRLTLEPTSRNRHVHRRKSNAGSQGTPRPDLDVFMDTLSHQIIPTIVDRRQSGSRENWPLSPTPQNNIKLNSSIPTLSAIQEPCDPGSPMLPSPALTSATLYPRKSVVPQGPRKAPLSTRIPRNASPSPLTRRTGQKPEGNELRRSLMVLRRGTGEGKLLDQATRLYRNMGEQSVSNFSSPNANQTNIELASKSTNQTSGYANVSENRRGSNLALNNAMGTTRSKMSMAVSPSMMSIWDDASICDEADLAMRNSMIYISE